MRKDLLLSLLTGILLSVAFPPFKIAPAAYWALVPFFYLLRNKTRSEAFFWGALTGAFIALSAMDITILSPLEVWGSTIFINAACLATYAAIHVEFGKRLGQKSMLLVPLLWVALEYLKMALWGGVTSGANLGFTHPHYLYLMKNAASLNVLAISFWLVMINVLIFSVLVDLSNKRKAIWLIASLVVLFIIPHYLEKRSRSSPVKPNDGIRAAFIA